jgi:hypothetical protein
MSFFKYVTICMFVFSTDAFAEDLSSATDPLLPGTFTTHQHSDEWLIRNALSAGPDLAPARPNAPALFRVRFWHKVKSNTSA